MARCPRQTGLEAAVSLVTFLRILLRLVGYLLLVPILRALRGNERAPSDGFMATWTLLLMVTCRP